MFTPSSCKDIGIKKLKFMAKINSFRLFKAMRRDDTIRKKIFYKLNEMEVQKS